MANVPVLTVNGLAIGETYHFVAGGGWQKTTPALDIYGPWGQNKSTALAATMPGVNKARYSLYICIQSSVPIPLYDVYVQPLLTNDSTGEKVPFSDEGGLFFVPMILNPNLGNKTWYVQFLPWFIQHQNWSDPGDYTLSIMKGYLQKGSANGSIPTFDGNDIDIPVTLS
jgi:hypothetical protein